jgi:heme exporter protein D
MLDLGPHAGFIVVSYALTALAVAGLIAWVFLEEAAQARRLAKLEERGLRRRSAPKLTPDGGNGH